MTTPDQIHLGYPADIETAQIDMISPFSPDFASSDDNLLTIFCPETTESHSDGIDGDRKMARGNLAHT